MVYGALFGGGSHLWRVALPGVGPNVWSLAAVAEFPAVSPAGNRLAFSRGGGDVDVWKFDGRRRAGERAVLDGNRLRSAAVARRDQGRVRHVGARVEGRRSGSRRSTARARSLSRRPPAEGRAVRDGRRMAAGSRSTLRGGRQLGYLRDRCGRRPAAPAYDAPGFEHFASWSRDGQWIYFRSARSGRSEVWRMPAVGAGDAVQMTTTGGAAAWESWDGQTLYYSRARWQRPRRASHQVCSRDR